MSRQSVRFRRRDCPYTNIANAALRDKRMSLAERGFLALLLSLPESDAHSIAYFAKVGNISTETVYKYFRKLETLGYLTREQEIKNGRFSTNIYDIHDVPDTEPCRNFSNTVEPNTEIPNTEKPDTKGITLERNNPPISPKGEESKALFDQFWEIYPRKVNKVAAWKAWQKISPDLTLFTQIINAVKAQSRSESWRRDGGRYIPYPSSWLNGRRWEDELPDSTSPSGSPPDSPPSGPEPPRRWVGRKIVDGVEVDVFE